jgi:branched-chain amino acid transport system substrate-binding protein
MLHSRIDPGKTTVRGRAVAVTAIALVILSATACWETHTYSPDFEEVLEIGALVSLSGSNSGAGLVHVAAMECALEDARMEFAEEGLDFRLNFSDTQSDPYAASVLMNNHLHRNIRVVIGPYTSAQVAAVESRIGDSQSLLISPSSTSLLLANRNDHIFRLAPNDSHMAESLADLIWRRGNDFLVLVYRDDPWGFSVATEVQREFSAKGGSVVSAYAYDPQNNNDLASLLRQVQIDITAATGGGPTSRVAIQLTSMDESVQFFRTAIDSVPQLRNVSWFGSDGFVGSWSIFSELALAEFAVDVDYTAPIYRVDVPDRFWHVIERIESTTGVTPGSYSLLTYDATRVAARTLANVGHSASYGELEATLATVMADYVGVSGWVELDAMGDRYDGEYDFFSVRTDGWSYWWARTSSSGRRRLPRTE